MAAGLNIKKAAGYLAAFFPLFALALVRLWAVLIGRVPGKALALLAAVFVALFLAVIHRLKLPEKLLSARNRPLTLLLAGLGFLAGGLLDVSYVMVDAAGTLLANPILHALCVLGSGLLFAGIVLFLRAALVAWGRPETGRRWQMLVIFLLVNAVALFYVRGSATVYVWDNAGYWTVARNLAQAPFGLAQLREAAASTVTMDYNYLLALPISWVMRVFGTGRAVFVFSIVNLYLLPAFWGLCVLGRDRKWGGLFLFLLFPGLTYIALVGYVDVAAAGAAIWAMVFYTRHEAPGWARGALTGAALVLSFLLRRYFLFFALAFGVSALVDTALRKPRQWKGFLALLGMSALTGLYCAQQFLVDKLTTDYGDIYSAYDLGLRSDFFLFCRYFGLLILLLALVRGVFLLIKRPARRPDALFALLQLALCFFLLTRVQSHGQQHTLLYLPGLALLLAPYGEAPKSAWRRAVVWALAAITAFVPLLPREQPASIAEIVSPDTLPGFSCHGPRREDIDQLVALADYLDGLCVDGQKSVSVCASSFLLNTETMTNLRPSLDLPASPHPIRYIYVSSVDKRDRFSWNMLTADYLVVGDPVQVHLGEENQQIIAIPAHQVLDGVGLGTAYTKLPASFTLADGSQVYVFRRDREIAQAEKQAISDALVARYPEHADLYQVP